MPVYSVPFLKSKDRKFQKPLSGMPSPRLYVPVFQFIFSAHIFLNYWNSIIVSSSVHSSFLLEHLITVCFIFCTWTSPNRMWFPGGRERKLYNLFNEIEISFTPSTQYAVSAGWGFVGCVVVLCCLPWGEAQCAIRVQAGHWSTWRNSYPVWWEPQWTGEEGALLAPVGGARGHWCQTASSSSLSANGRRKMWVVTDDDL